jgi:hypothetical protein
MATHSITSENPAHEPGLRKSEERSGHQHNGRKPKGGPRTSRDATSINADKRGPIDPGMPDMPPA